MVRFIEESVVVVGGGGGGGRGVSLRVTPTIKLWSLSCCIVFLIICGV